MTHNPPTSQLDLDAIQARTDAAFEGPWENSQTQDDTPVVYAPQTTSNGTEYAHVLFEADWGKDADAAFIAAARTDVPALVAEVRRLRAALANEERQHGDTIDDRDHFHEMADKLAYAVAPEDVIGEHSSMNCPWDNALDLITPMAEVDKLRQAIERVLEFAASLDETGRQIAGPDAVHPVAAHLRHLVDTTAVRPAVETGA